MNQTPFTERITTLLEAERAGVFTARALRNSATGPAQRELMELILDGERQSCRILGRTLLILGTTGSGQVGDFVKKVLALPDPLDRLRLLIKGQEWVVRKLDEAVELLPSPELLDPLEEVRRIHHFGIKRCREFLEESGKDQVKA